MHLAKRGKVSEEGEETPKGKTVAISFPDNFFYQQQGKDPKNREEIQKYLQGFFGPDTLLKMAGKGGSLNKSLEQDKQEIADVKKKEALEHPSVQQMKDVLGAQVVDVNVED